MERPFGIRPSRWKSPAGARAAVGSACLVVCLVIWLVGWPCGATSAGAGEALAVAPLGGAQAAHAEELSILRAAYRANPDDPHTAAALGTFLYERDKASAEARRLLELASRGLPRRHDVPLMLLESYLLEQNAPAVSALLGHLQAELTSDEAFGYEVAYLLLQHGATPDDPQKALELGRGGSLS